MSTDNAAGNALAGSSKPRLLMLCDREGWAFDANARNIARHAASDFDISIRYVSDRPEIVEEDFDLIWVFWWGEKHHKRYVSDRARVVKEISSHRWEFDGPVRCRGIGDAVERHMGDAGHLVTVSRRLHDALAGAGIRSHHYPKGVDTDVFHPGGERSGELRIGWAGNIRDPQKGVEEILRPACGGLFALRIADGSLGREDMAGFYRGLDVLCVASRAEGEPLTLLEGMACGCFPVCTDVGIVPELVTDGVNGLIVERTPEAFEKAFAWCRDNAERVRAQGRANAEAIRMSRSAGIAAARWAEVARGILAENGWPAPRRVAADTRYERHFERMNTGTWSESAYASACRYYREDIEGLLPADRDARILEVGTGYGHFLRYLLDRGYGRVSGVDNCRPLLQRVRADLGPRLERLELADAEDVLARSGSGYDCVVMIDVIEHLDGEKARSVVRGAHRALAPGGRLIVRTPNMANVLGAYSRYIDLTHRHGYTEFSLMQLLEEAGYDAVRVHVPTDFATPSRRRKARVNESLHRWLFRLHDRVQPRWFGKNVVVWADKGAR